MGIYDRDWYRESYKQKEEKYGTDFASSGNKQNTANQDERSRHKAEQKKRKGPSEKEQVHSDRNSNASSQQSQKTAYGSAYSVFPNNPIPAPFGEDVTDRNNIIGLGICPRCFGMFRIRTPKHALYEYSYSCPNCGQRITVMSEKPKSKGSSIAKRIFYGIGIVCICLIVLVFLLVFLAEVFPGFGEWMRYLLESIL